jgi:hypothetical protein
MSDLGSRTLGECDSISYGASDSPANICEATLPAWDRKVWWREVSGPRLLVRSRKLKRSRGNQMSRWADYQLITTIASKIGGPRVLALAVAAAGAVVYKSGEVGVKFIVKRVKGVQENLVVRAEAAAEDGLYRVTKDADVGDGLRLSVGDVFRILARDGDVVLIQVIGDADDSHYVSRDLLEAVSEFVVAGG